MDSAVFESLSQAEKVSALSQKVNLLDHPPSSERRRLSCRLNHVRLVRVIIAPIEKKY